VGHATSWRRSILMTNDQGVVGASLSRRGRPRGEGPSENGRMCFRAVSGCSASQRTQATR
jgi:hypothetical protein